MISLTSAQIDAWLAAFFFPLARISGLIAIAPVFGHRAIPPRVKVLLVLLLTIAVAPLMGELPPASPASGEGLAIFAEQILIGLTLGFVMRLAFAAVDFAGELTGLQMGLGFATFFDPQNADHTAVVAQFYGLLATLFFLALNGHLIVLSLLAKSFSTLPLGLSLPGELNMLMIAGYGAQVFVAGLLLALPIVAALLASNIALGMLTRAAPQLNLFAVGFPATLLAGIALLLLVVPRILPSFEGLFVESANRALDWAATVGK